MLRHSPCLLALLASLCAGASAKACAPAEASLAGNYGLRGVMEVGSQISLRADGSFEYMLAYGAVDELASGCWTREGNTVVLVPNRKQTNAGYEMFSRLSLKIEGRRSLRRDFNATHHGTYQR
jgi:hypothetical protein